MANFVKDDFNHYKMIKKIKYLFIALCLLCTMQQTHASELDGTPWISVDLASQQPNQWICFRKTVYLRKADHKIKMQVAVDSKYWLWVNGREVVFEGGLKRGPNPRDTYYDEPDVAKYFKKGRNTIAILVWYWGKDGFCHKSSGRSGLLVRLSAGGQTVLSDATWKVKIHPAFGVTGDPHPNYRLPEWNVHFDARKDIGAWYSAGYNDRAWRQATILGTYPCQPWNQLVRRPFPNWKYSAITPYDSVVATKVGGATIVRCKLPRNITVTPYIKLKAKAGLLVDIRSDNYRGGSEYNVRGEYVTRDGIQTFEMPNYINGHHILYTLPAGAECLATGYRETRFNTEHLGRFTCSDPFYSRLWQKALNTMNLNMRDAIQDPDRERSQWWGDAAIILHEIFYSCDGNGAKAVKKAILNLVDWQKDDGTLFSPVPAGAWDKELPLQMLASIGPYGFWSYYRYTGDADCMRYVYPHVRKYLPLWKIGPDGLLEHRAGGWDWADWGNDIDVPVVENAWYCLALQSAIDMANLAGDTASAAEYAQKLNTVRAAATQAFWNGSLFRSNDYKGKTDDRANAMAILAGFSNPEKNKKVADFLLSNANASPYMEKYVLEALFSNGFTQEALDRMKRRYTNMVNSPLTTLWEDWVIGGSGGGSINHGWAGSPLNLLSEYVAGVTPLETGWNTILVKPQLGSLQWVDCTVPVAGRTITVKASQKADEWNLTVDNATGKVCLIAIPQDRMSGLLTLNGTEIHHAQGAIDANPYIERCDQKCDGCQLFRLKTPHLVLKLQQR